MRSAARWLLPTLALSQFINALDYNIVVVALPKIGAELGFTEYTLQWVVGAYAVAFGGSLLLGGRLTCGTTRQFEASVVYSARRRVLASTCAAPPGPSATASAAPRWPTTLASTALWLVTAMGCPG